MAQLYDPVKLHTLLLRMGFAPHHREGTPHKKEIETHDGNWRKFIRFYILERYAGVPKLSTREVGTVVAMIEVEIGGGQSTAMLMRSCDDPNELLET